MAAYTFVTSQVSVPVNTATQLYAQDDLREAVQWSYISGPSNTYYGDSSVTNSTGIQNINIQPGIQSKPALYVYCTGGGTNTIFNVLETTIR
jgi:hypothetical protein